MYVVGVVGIWTVGYANAAWIEAVVVAAVVVANS